MTTDLIVAPLTVINPNDRLVELFLSQFSSQDTKTTYRYGIKAFRQSTGDRPFADVDLDDVSAFRAGLTGKPATQFTYWTGISSFYKWLTLAGYIERNPFLLIKGPRRTRNRAPVVPTDEQMHALINAQPGNDWRSRRDRAIVALCANGLRIAEVTVLRWDDLLPDDAIRVTGKGDKERIVPLSRFCIDALTEWANYAGRDSDLMFHDYAANAISGTPKPMTTRQVQSAFDRIAKSSGVAGMSPHKLRAHYATRLIRAGADVFSVQQLMGHEDISTTQVYVRLDLTDLRKAASLDTLA